MPSHNLSGMRHRLGLGRAAVLLLALLLPAHALAAPPDGERAASHLVKPPVIYGCSLRRHACQSSIGATKWRAPVIDWPRGRSLALLAGPGRRSSVYHKQRARLRQYAGFQPALPVETTTGPARRRRSQWIRPRPALLVGPTAPLTGTTPDGYARRLTDALDDARRAQQASGRARSDDIAHALAATPRTLAVRGNGHIVRADLTAIHDDLAAAAHGGGDARRLGDAITRLQQLRTALDAPSAHATAPDGRRLGELDHILNAPPFTSSPNLWTAIVDALTRLISGSPLGPILDAIARFLNGLFAGSSSSNSTVITVVAGLIVAVALIFVANRLFHPFAPLAGGEDDALGGDAGLTRVDAAGARARAATLAAAGQYREAVRYLYLSTLLALDEAGRLHIDEATGNRDILRQARATPRLAEALTPVVRLFDLFLFGHVPVTRDDYERYRQLNEQVLQAPR